MKKQIFIYFLFLSIFLLSILFLSCPAPSSSSSGGSGGGGITHKRFVYVANYISGYVSAYGIVDRDDVRYSVGELYKINDFKVGSGPISLCTEGSGLFLYVANHTSNDLTAFNVNPNSGSLIQIDADLSAPGIQNYPTGEGPVSVTMDPYGRFLYVLTSLDNSITMYRRDDISGNLTYTGNILTDSTPHSITVPPPGRYAYVIDTAGDIKTYSVNHRTGLLSWSYSSGVMSTGRAWPTAITAFNNGKFGYILNSSGDFFTYTIDSDTGTFDWFVSGVFSFPTGEYPYSISIDPIWEKFIYVANRDSNDVSGYRLNKETGWLQPIDADLATPGLQNFPTRSMPQSITIDPNGQFVYVGNWDNNSVSMFIIDSTTGILTNIGYVPAMLRPSAIISIKTYIP